MESLPLSLKPVPQMFLQCGCVAGKFFVSFVCLPGSTLISLLVPKDIFAGYKIKSAHIFLWCWEKCHSFIALGFHEEVSWGGTVLKITVLSLVTSKVFHFVFGSCSFTMDLTRGGLLLISPTAGA